MDRSIVKKIFSNTSWLIAEKLLTMVVSFGVTIVLARELGPGSFGSLNFLLAVVALVGPLTSLGLNSIVTREVINLPESSSKIMTTTAILRFGGGIIGALICVLIVSLAMELSKEDTFLIIVLAACSTFNAFQVIEFWFQSKIHIRPIAIVRFIVFLVFSGLKIGAVFIYGTLMSVTIVYAIEFILLGLAFLLVYRLNGQSINLAEFDFSYGLKLLKQSFWLILSGVAAVIYLKIDQVMLADMASREEVGIYSVAVRLSEVWYFFATAFVASIFPPLLKLRKDNNQKYLKRLQQCCDILFGISVAVAIVVSMFAELIIEQFFGFDYIASVPVLMVHIWAGVFVFMRALVSKWILAEGLLHFSLISQGIGAVVNVGVNIALIPQYGAMGAAVATVISYIFAGYLAFFLTRKSRPIAKIISGSLAVPFMFYPRYLRKHSKFTQE